MCSNMSTYMRDLLNQLMQLNEKAVPTEVTSILGYEGRDMLTDRREEGVPDKRAEHVQNARE